MSENNIFDAFKDLETLNEDLFSLDKEGIQDLKDFMDVDFEEKEEIIDPEATDEEELEDSYVGKVILCCDVCHSMIYKDPEDVVINEEDLVNVGEDCPYCHSPEGFKIIGEVAKYSGEKEETKPEGEEEVEVTKVEGEEAPLKEALNNWEKLVKEYPELEKKEESLEEDFQRVDIETDTEKMSMTSDKDGKTTVTTEPKERVEENEFIKPVSDEVKAEIERDSDIDSEEDSIEIDDFDEESFDELEESYLKKVYDNVNSYKTVSTKAQNGSLVVEGIISFNSGKEAKTKFLFENFSKTARGKLKVVGNNKQITESKNSFTITGVIKDKKLITEALTYNYKVKGLKDKIYGTVRNK